MPISKLEAAQRQLDCAIRLYLAEEDDLAVHTLSRAAFRILYDLYPTIENDGFSRDLDKMIQTLGWIRFNQVANFLKHADRDPNSTDEVHETDTQMGIGFAIILYARLSGGHTPEMRAFDEWMKVTHTDEFRLPPDPDEDIEWGFREAVEYLKTAPKEIRLVVANGLLKFFRDHPDGGNAWKGR
jgi:hypothetical protein